MWIELSLPCRINCCGEGLVDVLIPGGSLQSQQSICGCYRDKTSHPSGKTTFKENRREQLDSRDQRKRRRVWAVSAGKRRVKIQVDPKNINILLLLAKRRKMPRRSHCPHRGLRLLEVPHTWAKPHPWGPRSDSKDMVLEGWRALSI